MFCVSVGTGCEETATVMKQIGKECEITVDVFITISFQVSLKIMALATRSATRPAFTCSQLTIVTLDQGVKYLQS